MSFGSREDGRLCFCFAFGCIVCWGFNSMELRRLKRLIRKSVGALANGRPTGLAKLLEFSCLGRSCRGLGEAAAGERRERLRQRTQKQLLKRTQRKSKAQLTHYNRGAQLRRIRRQLRELFGDDLN
eukprot:s4040_g2.t1